MATMMVKPIRLKKQKQIGEPTPIPYPNLEEGMEVLYLPIQSKSEDSSSSGYPNFLGGSNLGGNLGDNNEK